MREIVLHRRAEKNLSRMPRHRQIQMLAALEEVADLANIS
jgi:mRNA-degrading endonuclease RelE of RelBE toxin-antitoxin system